MMKRILKLMYIRLLFGKLAKKIVQEFSFESMIITSKYSVVLEISNKSDLEIFLRYDISYDAIEVIIFKGYEVKQVVFPIKNIKNDTILNWLKESFLEMLIGD